MRIEQTRIRRGEILKVLYRYLPEHVGDNLLHQIFTEDTPTSINGQLRYLEEKGYIELCKVRKDYSTATVMAKIKPMGVDLLEGSIDPDPGIILPEL